MVAILFVTMETGIWQKKVEYVLLSKTHYTVWAETIALTVQFKNKSYDDVVSQLNSSQGKCFDHHQLLRINLFMFSILIG